jgi:mycothiol synthase
MASPVPGLEERAAAAAGLERWAYYAVNDATGDFVGLTDILVNPAAPERVHVGNTAVEPAHRGRALGKWLKGRITSW